MKIITLKDGSHGIEGDFTSQLVSENGLVRADPMVAHDILPLLKAGDYVVDAGAALGDHTRAYLNKVGATGKVLAFEPNPVYVQCLKHNCPEAIVYDRPLWFCHQELYLHICAPNVGASMLRYNPNPAGDGEVVGPCIGLRLDDLGLQRLDFVKLDVEGTELMAMLGMQRTVKRCRPKFVIEMMPGASAVHGVYHMMIYNLLEYWGYDHKPIRGNMEKYSEACDILAWPTS